MPHFLELPNGLKAIKEKNTIYVEKLANSKPADHFLHAVAGVNLIVVQWKHISRSRH
jgi:hypothetical protein